MPETEKVTITGTYVQCPQCHAPIILGTVVQQKVSVSGSPMNPLITPHTDDCTAGSGISLTPEGETLGPIAPAAFELLTGEADDED